MDLFEMLRQLNEMTNCFMLIAQTNQHERVIELFVEARDRASELLSEEAQREARLPCHGQLADCIICNECGHS